MNVWIVDDDSSIRWVLEKALTNAHFNCISFSSGQEAIDALVNNPQKPAVLISDIKMPGLDGFTLLHYVKEQYPDLPVIIMTAHSDLDAAVNAYQRGAYDYIPKPFDVDEVIQLVERAIIQTQSSKNSNNTTSKASTGIIGEAPAMQEVFRIIGRLSKSSISVLINGESGTGKELVAKALHTHSPRSQSPFIALNMAAIPRDLIESELFGHEKGAFTGAAQIRHGRFEQANGGTLFLDEIGDMPLDVQTRLLRVLADGQFYRIGGYSPVKVDVRIIAATHQDLEARVREGKFRDDLFHRLNVIRILLPPLRERAQDIPKLAAHFLHTTAKELGVESKVLSLEALDVLCKFNWSGNVRQLENACRWVTVMSSSKEILVQDLPPELLQLNVPKNILSRDVSIKQSNQEQINIEWQYQLEQWAKEALLAGKVGILTKVVADVERILLNCALNFTRGHKQDAAHLLGWGRNTLTRKLKELSDDK
ncbi:nitrogen regulation protein NR(I) [Gilliamella sp. B2776]|uniref:nitrogen regulation protein NR(I) n=1 Tax=unclassified Gilliamella TaxID=2685620 RepID=UPI002269BE18|nr:MULTISPECIES: nitrogen regulation protein NR(I) [unclassified Gilliamella]MCX8650284.1 nitrogen regulation protein NR(I) [Gilliamella sp. B2779]MCX8654358.1 nitrogen regulation protein NR(I) [Gilliamella sp. B2737]MCX8655998.1 nitrogen regulation protein NR(I) [Gilliamella sp. B2894]MCX8664101.1 nitrogen regulation protein NR(I) [Gilliamella sp. B2887]MCX8692057.1 nitrogen regulation protein NR(I) [Gilliamella sp. B2776]